VFAGSYSLIAYTHDQNAPRMGGNLLLNVTDRPLDVSLELRPAIDIPGTIEIEGEKTGQPMQMNLQLVPADQIGLPPPNTQTQADGTFLIKSVLPSTWRLNVYGPAFVKGMWMNGQELKDRVLDTSSGAGPLRVVVSTKTATLRGTGTPGQMVQAIPVGDADGGMMFRRGAVVGAQGEFTMPGLAPGRYRLSLGEADDPDGQQVVVAEGETAAVTLKRSPKP
jgi:hypothetical protein